MIDPSKLQDSKVKERVKESQSNEAEGTTTIWGNP
jgi:hypothetical protein